MDRFSITDRLESPTPVTKAGAHDSPRGDTRQKSRKREKPGPPRPVESAETSPEDTSHQIDELA